MENGFVKNGDLLREDYQVDDLLDFSETILKFETFLSNIKGNSLVGVIGDYGTGKSTMLYQLEKQNPDSWVVFDAWAFPNRKDLWEGFVLDFAKKFDAKNFDKARKRIDGTTAEDAKSLTNVIAEGANLFFPGAAVLKNFSSLFKSSPARRVFEFREMLNVLIKKQKTDLFIVLEDADRAGQEGMVFLETIKQFIFKELASYTEHKVTFIVPIGRVNYEDPSFEASYCKTIDYSFYFEPEINFDKFSEEIFSAQEQETNPYWKENLGQLCNFFISSGKTIRDLKAVLRMANHSYIRQSSIENFKPDARITILIEMHDHLKDGYSLGSLERNVKKIQMLTTGGKNFYGLFVLAVMNKWALGDVLKNAEGYNIPSIVFSSNYKLPIPGEWYDHFEKKNNWVKISDLYLRKSKTEV
jgi:hypothetical protein